MPFTKKGKKIMGAMKKEYGAKKGEKVFYASRNKGTIKGVEKDVKRKKKPTFESVRKSYFGIKK